MSRRISGNAAPWPSRRPGCPTGIKTETCGSPVRMDREASATGKTLGGGVCVYFNRRYCTSVREKICLPDIELMSVSLRPFYLPLEFPQIFLTVVYIHPRANATTACTVISDVVQKLQSLSPDAPNFILGDFNHVTLKKTLRDFYQYVTCPTRRGKTLDLCYGTIKDAYKSMPLPPLGSADHNCIQLLPTYCTVLRRENMQTKAVQEWTEESVMCLQECYDCTDWDIFKESCKDLDEMTDAVCSYVAFCTDMIIPSKQVKIYPNNKPWVNWSIKDSIQKKKTCS